MNYLRDGFLILIPFGISVGLIELIRNFSDYWDIETIFVLWLVKFICWVLSVGFLMVCITSTFLFFFDKEDENLKHQRKDQSDSNSEDNFADTITSWGFFLTVSFTLIAIFLSESLEETIVALGLGVLISVFLTRASQEK